MSSVPDERLREILDAAVESTGLLLEDLATKKAGRRTTVRVTIDLPDGPGGVTSDQLTEATHAVSAALDETDPISGTYTLEVTTPGIDRPLVTPRHFRRATGRLVEVTTADGTLTSRVHEVTDTDLVLESTTIPLAEVASARMVIDFGSAKKE
ncbi:MAG TPA: ribosome maturation factor RimP [Actinomycetaceae bacterium]|nr:ribosome maturation factor RimP [Actinomycetaceae bacterium]